MAILISPALVVSPAADFQPHLPLVGWHNQVTAATVSADSETTAYPATNLANPASVLLWVSDTTAEQLVTVINLSGQSDYVGVARHNWGSTGVLVSVEGLTAASSPDFVEIFEPVLLGDDTPHVLQFAKDYYTSIRLRLVPDAVAPRAAVVHVGELLTLPNGIEPGYTPLRDGQEVTRADGWSEAGEYLGGIVSGSKLTSAASIKNIDPDEYDAYVRPFVSAANNGAAFFFIWAPDVRPAEVAYCSLDRAAIPVINYETGEKDLTLSMGGLAL